MGGTVEKILDDPISTVATVVGYTLGGPVGAGIANTVAGVAQGEKPEDAIKGGALAAAGSYVGGEVFGGATGGSETGAFDIAGNPDILGGTSEGIFAAPVSSAVGTPATELQYPGVEVAPTSSVVPGSLQAALPELGVQTAATTAPFTAVPGSFPAATYGGLLGATGAVPPTASLSNVFRGAQLVNSLFARPQMPQVNPYQLMQQQQGLFGQVDYTPTLNLLATRPTPQSLV